MQKDITKRIIYGFHLNGEEMKEYGFPAKTEYDADKQEFFDVVIDDISYILNENNQGKHCIWYWSNALFSSKKSPNEFIIGLLLDDYQPSTEFSTEGIHYINETISDKIKCLVEESTWLVIKNMLNVDKEPLLYCVAFDSENALAHSNNDSDNDNFIFEDELPY